MDTGVWSADTLWGDRSRLLSPRDPVALPWVWHWAEAEGASAPGGLRRGTRPEKHRPAGGSRVQRKRPVDAGEAGAELTGPGRHTGRKATGTGGRPGG